MDKKIVVVLGGAAVLAYLWLRGQASGSAEMPGGTGGGFYDTSGGLGSLVSMAPSSGTSLDRTAPTTIKVDAPTFPEIPTEAETEAVPTSKKAFTSGAGSGTQKTSYATTPQDKFALAVGTSSGFKIGSTNTGQPQTVIGPSGLPAYAVVNSSGQIVGSVDWAGNAAPNYSQGTSSAPEYAYGSKKAATVAATTNNSQAYTSYIQANNLIPTPAEAAKLKQKLGG